MKVVFVVGPTASGKTQLALELAQAFKGEIINADSLQVYKGLDIGTAKPAVEQLQQIRHHLIDVVNPPNVLTAGDYRRLAFEVLRDCDKRHVPFVFIVGGSGFYIQALEKGMFELGKVSERIRAEVLGDFKKQGLKALYQELYAADEAFAEKIGPHDEYRILRAIELLREFKKTPTELRQAFKPELFPYQYLKIGLEVDRETLKKRIAARTQLLFANGLIEEVRDLLSRGLVQWAPMESVGYKETVKFLNSEISHDECIRLVVQNTQRLAKRQMTWFRRDPEIWWVHPDQGSNGPIELIRSNLCS